MEIFHKTVSQELCDAIKTRQVELEGIRNLIAYCLSQKEYDIPVERLADLQNKYTLVFQEYEVLKGEVEKLFINDVDRNKTSWDLNFDTCEVTITVND